MAVAFCFEFGGGDGGDVCFLFFCGLCLRDSAELVVVDEFRDGGVFATDGALWIFAEFELLELHFEGIEVEEAAHQGIADAANQFDCFDCLDDAYDAGEHAEHAAFCAAGDHAWRRGFGEHAAVARAAEVRCEDGALAVEAEDRTVDVRFFEENGDVIGAVTGWEVVCSVDDDVVGFGDLPCV